MNRKTLLILIMLVSLTLATAGCNSAPVTDSAAILITYTPAFTLQPDSDNIFMVDLEVENSGYRSFSVNPAYFSLLVNDREYSPEIYASELETRNLTDGDKTKGRLVFQLPPDTVPNIVNFGMGYSRTKHLNIVWKDTSSIDFTNIDSSNNSIPVVIIKYDPAIISLNSEDILAINIDLQNMGYDNFELGLRYFTLLTGGAVYYPSIDLSEPYSNPESSRVIARIAFEVPSGITSYNLL